MPLNMFFYRLFEKKSQTVAKYQKIIVSTDPFLA